MRVKITRPYSELPEDLRRALARFAAVHMDGTGFYLTDVITIEGRRLPHPEVDRHPNDDATGFAAPTLPAPAETAAGPAHPDSIPNIDPWGGYR